MLNRGYGQRIILWEGGDSFIYLMPFVFFQHGITQANELVNLTEFFVNHILTDLKSPNGKGAHGHLKRVC